MTILVLMNYMKDVRNVVAYVDDLITEDKKNGDDVDKVAQHYASDKNISIDQSVQILKSAIADGYLQLHRYNKGIAVTDGKGRQLLSKILRIFPLGYWEECLKAYSSLTTVVVTVLVSGTFGAILTLVIAGAKKLF